MVIQGCDLSLFLFSCVLDKASGREKCVNGSGREKSNYVKLAKFKETISCFAFESDLVIIDVHLGNTSTKESI